MPWRLQVWVRQKDVEAESEVFHELPHKLRTMIAWHFNESAFRQLPLFVVRCCSSGLAAGLQDMSSVRFMLTLYPFVHSDIPL